MIQLKTEGRINPLGIDVRQPEFSWMLLTKEADILQKSYQLRVTDERGELVWDSGEVQTAESIEIRYEGQELKPCTRYLICLKVQDQKGNCYQADDCFFETGLMTGEMRTLGDGAEWIGVRELTLDAASACYFDLRVDLTLQKGCLKAGVVFGAGDFRLKNKNFNIWGIAESENYFLYSLDIEPLVRQTGPAVLWIESKGLSLYEAEEGNSIKIEIPEQVIDSSNLYQTIQMGINTVHGNVNQVTCTINGSIVDENRQLNPLGNTHDYNTFPNLNEIGFFVPGGMKAVFENLMIFNPGPYSEGILFAQDTGAGYGIFAGLEGVCIEDGKMIVGGDSDILVHADPSYGSAPMLRREFETAKKVKKARLYISAHGIYEAWINGERVGDHWFDPGNSEYRERIGYQTFDVTEHLQGTADHAMAVQLAEGWWSGYQTFIVHNYNYYGDRQALMAKLVITYDDQSTEVIVTEEKGWSGCSQGPVEYGSFFNGERYNACKEMDGWKLPGFSHESFVPSVIVPTETPFSQYRFMTRKEEPIRVIRSIQASSVRRTSDDMDLDGNYSYLYDMGENVLGVPQIQIPQGLLSAGQTVTIRYAEVLYPSNLPEYQAAGIADRMMVENYRAAMSTDFYTAKDSSSVIIEPHYTYHGMRYIELSGLREALPLEAVRLLLLTSMQQTSEYETSDPLVNRLYLNVRNSQNSNFISLPTDCPQRNERLGWTGDAQVFSMAASYNGDVYDFYRQWLFTLRDEQFTSGALPVFAPSYPGVYDDIQVLDANSFFGGVSWDAAIVLIPYHLYLQYGKKEVIRENMEAIQKYLGYLKANPMQVSGTTYSGLTEKTGILADWLSIEETDYTLINNAVYGHLLHVASKLANILGDQELSRMYQTAFEETRFQWNKLYVDENGYTRSCAGDRQDTQASYATPLRYGMFAEENEHKAVLHFCETVRRTLTNQGNYTIKTGFSGTPNLVPVLSGYGYVEEAYRLFESKEYASWLYPVLNGATSVWERWNSYTVEGGFNGNNSMNSFNHFSLGAIYEWMMSYQLGIMYDESRPGYQHFLLQPQMGGSFTFAGGSFLSPYGKIHSSWTREEQGLWKTYRTVVPPNTTADLYLPVGSHADVLSDESAFTFLGITEHNGLSTAHFVLSSGTYEFVNSNGVIEGHRC